MTAPETVTDPASAPPPETAPQPSPVELAELVARDRQARERACMDQISQVLQAHRCTLDAVTTYVNGQLAGHQVRVTAG